MKKFFILCLMAFMVCSCDTKQSEAVNNYVANLTEDNYKITKIEKMGVILTYDDYMKELEDVKEWCKNTQDLWIKFLNEYPSYAYNDKTTREAKQRIDSAIDVEIKCNIEARIANKEDFKPIYRYRCEYQHKGMNNTIYLFLKENILNGSYEVQLMGEHFFNLKP